MVVIIGLFETGLFWFKDELHQFDKELNFDTITNTDGLTSYITDKILKLEIQIGEELKRKVRIMIIALLMKTISSI